MSLVTSGLQIIRKLLITKLDNFNKYERTERDTERGEKMNEIIIGVIRNGTIISSGHLKFQFSRRSAVYCVLSISGFINIVVVYTGK